MTQLRLIGKVSKKAGRNKSLARSRSLKRGAGLLTYTTRQTNHLTAQLSQEGQANPNSRLYVVSGILDPIRPPSGSSHRSAHSMGRFLNPCSEAPWTPEVRRETYSESRLTELSALSSKLSIIGSPIQEPPCAANVPTYADTSNHPFESYTRGPVRVSKTKSDDNIDPRGEVSWTPKDLGQRGRVAGHHWMEDELLCMRGDDEVRTIPYKLL